MGPFVISLASSKNKTGKVKNESSEELGSANRVTCAPVSDMHLPDTDPHTKLCITLIHTNTQSGRVSQCPFHFASLLSMFCFFLWRQLWFFYTLSGSMPGGDIFRCDVIALKAPGSSPFIVLHSTINITSVINTQLSQTNGLGLNIAKGNHRL